MNKMRSHVVTAVILYSDFSKLGKDPFRQRVAKLLATTFYFYVDGLCSEYGFLLEEFCAKCLGRGVWGIGPANCAFLLKVFGRLPTNILLPATSFIRISLQNQVDFACDVAEHLQTLSSTSCFAKRYALFP